MDEQYINNYASLNSTSSLNSHDVESSLSRYEFAEENYTKKKSDLDILESVLLKRRFRTPIPNIDEIIGKYKETKKPIHSKNDPHSIDKESLISLKDSTKKLVKLLEDIQRKTKRKYSAIIDEDNITEIIKTIPTATSNSSINIIGQNALKKLEEHAKLYDYSTFEQEEDDCSVYKKLIRKCCCLTNIEYNDFVIHFNEETKIYTNSLGEIIKNLRLLKKFLYMGGDYSKRALMFLNEGLIESSHTERVEITQGCSFADICNIFEENSIVIILISWPCKYEYYGDASTQALTASFLFKLAQLEEGRRYLKFNSKITNDLKKVLRKKTDAIEFDTIEIMNDILNLLHPPLPNHAVVTYYCKPINEGFGIQTMNALIDHREYMTFDEVFTHLDLLNNMSDTDNGKTELISKLPTLLNLFICMLVEYDNSEMNIIITNILNNIISRNMIKRNDSILPKVLITADAGTEPIKMKNIMIQAPATKKNTKKANKSKITLGGAVNFRETSKRKIAGDWRSSNNLNRSKKILGEGNKKSTVIVVPIE